MFAQLYYGCKCGETWQVASHQECDSNNDEVYEILYCTVCNQEVRGEKKDPDGTPHYHALTEWELEGELWNTTDDYEFDDNP